MCSRIPPVVAGEDFLCGVSLRLVVGQIFRPFDSFVRLGAGAGAGVFGIPGGRLVGGVAPVVPALGADVAGEFRADERGRGELAPGSAEESAFLDERAGGEPNTLYTYRPPLIGRQSVVATLHAQLDRLAQGIGGLLLLSGESGMGKTRLLSELATEARRLGGRL